MILTGKAIKMEVERGGIVVDPFNPENVGPNSLDVTLGARIKVYDIAPNDGLVRTATFVDEKGIVGTRRVPTFLDPTSKALPVDEVVLPPSGLVLMPGKLYLGHTVEVVGGDNFVAQLGGRSSMARLGLMVHVTGGYGDLGFCSQWTLEMVAVHPILVMPGIRIGQFWFFPVHGEKELYRGKYLNSKGVVESRMHEDFPKAPAPAPPPAEAKPDEQPGDPPAATGKGEKDNVTPLQKKTKSRKPARKKTPPKKK